MLFAPPSRSISPFPFLSPSPPLPAPIVGCYVNAAHMQLEEEWAEANAATVNQLTSKNDLSLIEEVSSDEAEEAIYVQAISCRHSAVQAESERRQRLLHLVTAADDAQDAKIQLSRRQHSSSSDEESDSEHDRLEGKYENVSEDGSVYSDHSAESDTHQCTTDAVQASSGVKGRMKQLVVTTRAMRKREQQREEHEQLQELACPARPPVCQRQTPKQAADDTNRAEVFMSAASESNDKHKATLPPVFGQSEQHPTAHTQSSARAGEDQLCVTHPSTLPRPQPLTPSLPPTTEREHESHQRGKQNRLPSPQPQPLMLSLPTASPSKTTKASPPTTQHGTFQPTFSDEAESGRMTSSSMQFEQMTLAEHVAHEEHIRRLLAKETRQQGRQAHKQQQKQQKEEQEARQQAQKADEANWAMWHKWSGKAMRSAVKRRRIVADESLATCLSSLQDVHKEERSSQLCDSDCDGVTETAGRPRKDQNKHPKRMRSPPVHRRGGRYTQLPGMPHAGTLHSEPDVKCDTNQGGESKRGKSRKRQDEEWKENSYAASSAKKTAEKAARWLAKPPPADFFLSRAPRPDVRNNSTLPAWRGSSCSTVSSTSDASSSSSSTGRTVVSVVESRDELAKRERVRTLSHFSFLGR